MYLEPVAVFLSPSLKPNALMLVASYVDSATCSLRQYDVASTQARHPNNSNGKPQAGTGISGKRELRFRLHLRRRSLRSMNRCTSDSQT